MSLADGLPWRTQWVVPLLILWAIAAHLASIGVGPVDLHLGIAIAPLLAAGMVIAWQSALRGVGAVVLMALVLGALAWAWPRLRGDVAWLYYLQHLGTHLAIAAWFGRSLGAGRTPVVTEMTALIFGTVTPGQQRYTRSVTCAWTIFLISSALVSTLLFALAPTRVWSLYANLLTGPLIGVFFAIEMLVRRRVLPASERPALRDVVRVARAHFQAADHAATPPAQRTP